MENGYHDGLRIVFSEPVSRKQLLSHLHFTPSVANLKRKLAHDYVPYSVPQSKGDVSRTWFLKGTIAPNQKYRIQLKPGLQDLFGRRLKRKQNWRFTTTSFPPGLFVPKEGEGVREPWQTYPVAAVNAKRIEVRKKNYRGSALITFLRCVHKHGHRWPDRCIKFPNRPDRILSVQGPKDQIQEKNLDLPYGLTALALKSAQVVNHKGEPLVFYRFSTRTNLGIHARMSPFGVVAWVTALSTGRALKDVRIRIFDHSGKMLAAGTTDAGGFFESQDKQLVGRLQSKRPPVIYVLAEKAKDAGYVVLAEKHYGSKKHQSLPYRQCVRYDCMYKPAWHEINNVTPIQLYNYHHRWPGRRPQSVAYLSTERGIYRPGQTVHFHGAVRVYHTWRGRPAEGHTVRVELRDNKGTSLQSVETTTERFGVFLSTLDLPRKHRLGVYEIRLYDGEKQIARHRFRVAEYRAPRFRTLLHMSPSKLTAYGRVKLSISGRYLFGGTMGKARYRFSVRRSPTHICDPKHCRYTVGRSYSYPGKSITWKQKKGKLDHTGTHTTVLDLKKQPGGHYPWMCTHSAEAEITSSALRSVAARESVLQYPADVLVGIKKQPSQQGRIHVHVQLFDIHWHKTGGRKIDVAFYPLDKYRHTLDLKRPFWKKKMAISKAGKTLAFSWPKKYDHHRGLLIVSAKDDKKRASKTALTLYRPAKATVGKKHDASKRAPPSAPHKKSQNVRPRMTIHLDKDEYLPGETAHIKITRRNVAGDAILLAEREKIFFKTTLQFNQKGVARISLPIADRFAPTVVLRAMAVQKKHALRGKHAPLVTATKKLRVSLKPFELNVGIETDKKTYRPGERVAVHIQVKDKLGRKRPAQVVIMAVDEAVLQLSRYMLPNPLNDLLYQPPLQTVYTDLRSLLAPLNALKTHRDHAYLTHPTQATGIGRLRSRRPRVFAATASVRGGLPQKVRKQFLTTAWHTTVATDAQGRAKTVFTLPDNLTKYRLMAFAVDGKRSAGLGYHHFKVSLPLLTMPSLPRFVRSADRFFGAITIYNKSLPSGTATVRVKVRSAGIKLTGPHKKQIHLEQGCDIRVPFAFEAVHPGEAQLEFTVSRGQTTDTVIHPLVVKPNRYPEVATLSGRTQGAVSHAVEELSELRRDYGELKIKLASSALVGIEHAFEHLIDYPYHCLEQQGSRAIGLLTSLQIHAGGQRKQTKKHLHHLRHTLQSMITMQRKDGGFGYWPNATQSFPWGTAYALVVFARLRRAEKITGQRICRSCVKRAVRYLQNILKKPKRLGYLHWSLQAFIVYALSLHSGHGKKDLVQEKKLAQRALALHAKRNARPLFFRALLLATLAQLSKTPQLKGTLRSQLRKSAVQAANEVEGVLRVDGDWAYADESQHSGYTTSFHSNTRTTAGVLLALLAARPDHPMLLRLVRWFVGGRKKADFRNTQEAAWALMAMEDFVRIHEKHKPDFESGVWLGKKRLIQAMFGKHSHRWQTVTIPMKQLMQRMAGRRQRLVIAKRGTGTLYYSAQLRYARKQLPEKPRNHGFTVKKTIQVLGDDGRPCKTAKAPQLGDTVLVTVKVKPAEPSRYVVIEDPLPAGLEALDTTLATASRTFGAHQTWTRASFWNHRELRDDRVLFFRNYMSRKTFVYRYLARVTTAGRFHTPPTSATEMYTPEVFGHGATTPVVFKTR
jgi:hypothetical protein